MNCGWGNYVVFCDVRACSCGASFIIATVLSKSTVALAPRWSVRRLTLAWILCANNPVGVVNVAQRKTRLCFCPLWVFLHQILLSMCFREFWLVLLRILNDILSKNNWLISVPPLPFLGITVSICTVRGSGRSNFHWRRYSASCSRSWDMLNASFVHLDFVVFRLAILWCLLGVGRRSYHCAEAVGHPPFSDKHKHLSLHHYRTVRSVLFEILLGCGKDLLFVAAAFACWIWLHRSSSFKPKESITIFCGFPWDLHGLLESLLLSCLDDFHVLHEFFIEVALG